MPEPVPGPVTVPEHEPAAAPVADPPLEPAPAPPAAEAPAGPDPGTGDLTTRARAAFVDAVPPQWASLVGSVTVIGGSTSLAWEDGRIQISRFHASGPWWRLRAVVAHEVGHLIAFRHGSQAYFGAPPSGAPLGAGSEEVWGECVAAAFTGAQVHHECGPDAVDWTREWLSAQR